MKIIDAHAHIVQYISGFTSRGELRAVGGGKAQYATGEIIQMFPPELGDIGVTPEALLNVMDENGVEKSVLLQGNWLGFQNGYTAAAIKKYPSRFTGAATYDPFCVKVKEIRNHLFNDLGFKAVKFELSNGSGLMANRPPVFLDGTVMRECFADAGERGLTVVLDIGRPRNPCWQIDAISSAVDRFPQVTFVFCHLLAPQREDIGLLKTSLKKLALPNVYFDISSLAHNQQPERYPYPTAVEHLKNAKAIVGADRLMFGTDMPCNLARDSYAHLKDYIIRSDVFTEKELEDIFYNTAEKVYFRK
ncbi:MAG: amidohydrolase [Clostridia bacterium]|nr:amidohydrolase [Clostridia bacterium]